MITFLAYNSLVYIIASVYYLIKTKNIGTPFKNSLSPEQIQIKKIAANQRKQIFFQGIAIAILYLFFAKPL
jgi:hypothetical protein